MNKIGFLSDSNEVTMEALIRRVARLENLFVEHTHCGPDGRPVIPAAMKMEDDNSH